MVNGMQRYSPVKPLFTFHLTDFKETVQSGMYVYICIYMYIYKYMYYFTDSEIDLSES